jgi:hypothetical protein
MTSAALPTMSPDGTFPTYTGPGYVEIKPHTLKGIRSGLAQLYKNKKGFTGPYKRGKKPIADVKAYLLTYTYKPSPAHGGSTVEAYLLEPTPKALDDNVAKAGERRDPVTVHEQRDWLNGLGRWWVLLPTSPVEEQTFGQWVSHAGPSAAGFMLENQLRSAFLAKYVKPGLKMKAHLTAAKAASAGGADIDFLELAEFLYELDTSSARSP